MKKILILLTLMCLSLSTYAVDKIWNFSTHPVFSAGRDSNVDPWPVITTVDGLTLNNPIEASGTKYGTIDSYPISFSGESFSMRFKTGIPADKTFTIMPTYGYFSFPVLAGDTVKVWFTSNAVSAARTAYITDGTSIKGQGTSANSTTGVLYSGIFISNATAYVFSNDGVFFFKIEVCSVATGLSKVISLGSISKAGTDLINPQSLAVEVYNINGVKVLNSSEPTINLSSLANGVYVAKTSQGTLKFIK